MIKANLRWRRLKLAIRRLLECLWKKEFQISQLAISKPTHTWTLVSSGLWSSITRWPTLSLRMNIDPNYAQLLSIDLTQINQMDFYCKWNTLANENERLFRLYITRHVDIRTLLEKSRDCGQVWNLPPEKNSFLLKKNILKIKFDRIKWRSHESRFD